MRQVGWATGIGVFAIIAVFAGTVTPAAACPGEGGCDDTLSVLIQSEQLKKADAEAARADDVGAPLSLQSRKAAPRKTQKATRQTSPAASRNAASRKPSAERSTKKAVIPDPPQAVKDANARAHDDDIAAAATQAVPIVEASEVNEIDAAAAAPDTIQDTANQIQEPAPEPPPAQVADAGAKVADTPQPHLGMLQVETPEQTQSVSNGDSSWGNTSTIGKVFIALGGFLAAASAIRMFVG